VIAWDYELATRQQDSSSSSSGHQIRYPGFTEKFGEQIAELASCETRIEAVVEVVGLSFVAG